MTLPSHIVAMKEIAKKAVAAVKPRFGLRQLPKDKLIEKLEDTIRNAVFDKTQCMSVVKILENTI